MFKIIVLFKLFKINRFKILFKNFNGVQVNNRNNNKKYQKIIDNYLNIKLLKSLLNMTAYRLKTSKR